MGDEQVNANPKLNNMVKGWDAAQHPWIIIADSNVMMPADYIQQMRARWRPHSGLVCSPPVGSRPAGFWAEVECAFLNGFQARFQYGAECVGLGFAQGKSMLFRRDIIEAGGGIRALGRELAEDAATTKLIRAQGLTVHLVDRPFDQPLGRRSAYEVWKRQLRWARLRRATFPLHFLPEAIAGGAVPTIALACAAAAGDVPVMALPLFWAVWYGAEILLTRAAGWHLSRWTPLALAARDLMLPVLWIDAWLFDDFTWRGNDMKLHQAEAGSGSKS